ncbi:hypothetical protein SAMN02787142_5960 [Burkholderia sp. WP9]|nr:hypothetical protein SAMN02787142_5960 [Burkholderia sp. WP9]
MACLLVVRRIVWSDVASGVSRTVTQVPKTLTFRVNLEPESFDRLCGLRLGSLLR